MVSLNQEAIMSNAEILGNIKSLIDATLEAAKVYEHSYGQAREEALADYGNKYNKMYGEISRTLYRETIVLEPEWFPIETAPRDGTEVLLKDEIHRQPWHYTAIWNGISWYHGFGDAWPKPNPTHWSPIPKDKQKQG
jgi:hypothetical protein